jgi:tripartite motif-containing protein 71
MKKVIFPLVLICGTFLSWACNSSSTPSNPNATGPRGGSQPTAVPTPTFALTPPAYAGGFSTAFSPSGLAIAGGVTYVAEADDNSNATEVQVFAAGSTASWTAYGPTTFLALSGIVSNSAGTTIYVLDSGDGMNDGSAAVYAFTGAGATITSWNSYGPTKFYDPYSLALDNQGNVYVADTYNNQVEEFGPAGNATAVWTGYNGTSFNGPGALAFDVTGNLYVGDVGNEVVDEFSGTNLQTSAYQWTLDNGCYAVGIAVDATGHLYVADYGYEQNGQLDPNFGNGLMEEYGPNGGPQLTAWSYGTNFGPIAVLLSGLNIWVADNNNNLIDEF